MSDELNDLIKKYGDEGSSQSQDNGPQFRSVISNEGAIPDFNLETELSSKNENSKSNKED